MDSADLKRVVPHECPLAVIPLPGAVLQHVVLYSHREASREPPVDSGGFLQLDQVLCLVPVLSCPQKEIFKPEKLTYDLLCQGMLLNEDGSALHVRGCAFDPENVSVCFSAIRFWACTEISH